MRSGARGRRGRGGGGASPAVETPEDGSVARGARRRQRRIEGGGAIEQRGPRRAARRRRRVSRSASALEGAALTPLVMTPATCRAAAGRRSDPSSPGAQPAWNRRPGDRPVRTAPPRLRIRPAAAAASALPPAPAVDEVVGLARRQRRDEPSAIGPRSETGSGVARAYPSPARRLRRGCGRRRGGLARETRAGNAAGAGALRRGEGDPGRTAAAGACAAALAPRCVRRGLREVSAARQVAACPGDRSSAALATWPRRHRACRGPSYGPSPPPSSASSAPPPRGPPNSQPNKPPLLALPTAAPRRRAPRSRRGPVRSPASAGRPRE